MVSFNSLIAEFCLPEERPTYLGIANATKGITVTIISLIGGFLADVLNFKVAFIIAMIMISFGTYLLLTKVKEPRYEI